MITYYDRNGVELHHGDEIEFVAKDTGLPLSEGPYFVHEDNDMVPLKNKVWGEKYTFKGHKSNVVKKPDPVVDARGFEINVGDHIWAIPGAEHKVLKVCKDYVVVSRAPELFKGTWTIPVKQCVVVPS